MRYSIDLPRSSQRGHGARAGSNSNHLSIVVCNANFSERIIIWPLNYYHVRPVEGQIFDLRCLRRVIITSGVRHPGVSCMMLSSVSGRGTLATSGLKLWKEKLTQHTTRKVQAIKTAHIARDVVTKLQSPFLLIGGALEALANFHASTMDALKANVAELTAHNTSMQANAQIAALLDKAELDAKGTCYVENVLDDLIINVRQLLHG